MKRIALLSLALCLTTPALAATDLGAPMQDLPGLTAPPAVPAPAVAPVAPPVVYVAAPAAAPASSGSAIAALLSAVPLDTWALMLGVLGMLVLQLLGARGVTTKAKVDEWIDLAYYAAEAASRVAGPDSKVSKVAAALDKLHQGLMGEGIKVSAVDIARAQARWGAMAEAEHVAADVKTRAILAAQAEQPRPSTPPAAS